MKRHWVFALAVLAALPRLAHAQGDGWGPVLRVTPFVGISPGINQVGTATVFSNSGVSGHDYRLEYSSSIPLGLALEYRAWDRFSAVAEGVWSRRGTARLIDFEDEVIYDLDGTNFWMAKAGAAMRLRESTTDMQLRRLNASVFIAPAFIHDAPNVELGTPAAATNNINQWGLNLGADAELPLANSRYAFNLALEDWIIFWDEPNYGARLRGYIQTFNPNINEVSVEAKKTNLWILRAGFSFRF